jgi:3-oxoadipate enol-lactonase
MSGRADVPRGDFSLSALETGQGAGAPVVVLSNSLAAGLGSFAPQRALLESRYRVIGYDTRGHGLSGSPKGPYTFDDVVADVLAVMDHFGVERANYLGLSFGGMTGLGLGLKAPERVEKLICCAARADNPPAFVKGWDDRLAAIQEGGLAKIWPGTLERWLTEDYRASHPEVVAELEADFVATSVTGYSGCAAALKQLSYLKNLGGLKVPTLYISGSEDMGAPAAAMEEMAAATPGAKYICIDGAAHFVNRNAEAAFNAAILDYLAG